MRLFALFLLLSTVVVAQTQAQDDRVVSFSYNKISSLQYTADWPDYEEDTIFAPNSVNPPLAGPMPHVRFLGKGAGSEIETDAISYGYRQHPGDVNGLSLYFGVSAHADGLPGTAVRTELPADRGADIFLSEQNGTNRQVYDGNGQLMQAGARKLGLMELGSANIDGLDMRATADQFLGINPLQERAFYWSVADENGWGGGNAQPEYALPGYTGRDIFYGLPQNGYSNNPAGIQKYADGGDLGLTAGDDVDALVVVDLDGNPRNFDPLTDAILYSLSWNSSSLDLPDFAAAVGNKTGGDVFQVGLGALSPIRYATAAAVGLDAANDDDLVALDFALPSMVGGYVSTVPEPRTLLLVLMGLIFMPLRDRRRRIHG
jgi:hypothetical protein